MALRWIPQDAGEGGDVDPFEPLEMVRRVERSELGPGTLEALHAGAERLCCGYSTMPPAALRQEAEQQLRYVRRLLDGRKTFSQHRELLVIAGWLSLLLGCVHNDMGSGGRRRLRAMPLTTLARKPGIQSSSAGPASFTAGSL